MSLSIDKVQNTESVAFISRCKYVTSSCNNITLQIYHVAKMSHTLRWKMTPLQGNMVGVQWKLRVDPLQGNMVTRNIKGES